MTMSRAAEESYIYFLGCRSISRFAPVARALIRLTSVVKFVDILQQQATLPWFWFPEPYESLPVPPPVPEPLPAPTRTLLFVETQLSDSFTVTQGVAVRRQSMFVKVDARIRGVYLGHSLECRHQYCRILAFFA